MSTRLGLALVPVLSLAATAQGPPVGYYDTVDTSSPATLRATLHAVIDDHTRIPYTSGATDTWDVLNMAMQDPNNASRIIDVYRNESFPKISGGSRDYNREHTWPVSYGFPDDNAANYPFSDCHMLWLCDAGYNTTRSNKPFRNCSAACFENITLQNKGMGGGSGVYPGNSNWTSGAFTSGTWEVWIGKRGDIARAQFYADLRYDGGTHNVTGVSEPDLILTDNQSLIAASNTGNNEAVAYHGMLSVLLQWHLEDPVDACEMNRNDVVFNFQGNRNPFVDHPEWVDCLYNGVCGGTPAPQVYCTGKLNSQFCIAEMDFSGSPSETDVNPFDLTADMAINNKSGLLFYGYAQANLAFLGGTLCVQPPLRRTAVQFSGGNPPPEDCSGTYAFDFNALIQSGLDPMLVQGTQVFAQYWYRDPNDFLLFGSGLSDAVQFTIAP